MENWSLCWKKVKKKKLVRIWANGTIQKTIEIVFVGQKLTSVTLVIFAALRGVF